jgi:short-subunit dehydrogenase
MPLELAGRRVLVTGSSSGLGAGMAEAFASRGAVVGLCARRRDRMAEVLERCRVHTPESAMWVTDLSDPDAVDGLAADVLEAFGGVDLLVNNAGIPKRRHVTRLDPGTVEAVMNINYLSPVRLTLALLPHMLARQSGHIVNVSSVAAPLSSPGEAAYAASKAALAAFSESMAIDVWDQGIKMTVIYPGVVDTELFILPDNEPSVAGVEPMAVAEFVDAVMEGLDAGAAEIYVPAWFSDIVVGKVQNLQGFLSGAAEFVRQQGQPG